MPNPKRRHSNTRTRNRRTHWKATAPTLSVCSHCKQPKLDHRVCPNCGHYKGREVVRPRES